MAEALIKATDYTHPNAFLDSGESFKRGDVVLVKPDGYEWSLRERDPERFVIISVPDTWLEADMIQSVKESLNKRLSPALRRMGLAKSLKRQLEQETKFIRRFAVDLDNDNTVIDKGNS